MCDRELNRKWAMAPTLIEALRLMLNSIAAEPSLMVL